jgi:hypothetical protein
MIEVPPDVRVSVVVGYATGVVARARDCELFEAFDRLSQCAVELGQSLEHTALDVLDGVIRFGCDCDVWTRPNL